MFFLDFFSQKSQLYVYTFSCLFTFSSAVCLLFCQLIVYLCQLFVYNLNFPAKNLGFPPVFCQNNASKLEMSVSSLFTFSAVCLLFRQLFVYNLNFRAKNLVFPWLFCHYRCFSTLIVKWEHFNFLPFCSELFRIHISNSVVLWESGEVAWFCSELFRNWEVKVSSFMDSGVSLFRFLDF